MALGCLGSSPPPTLLRYLSTDEGVGPATAHPNLEFFNHLPNAEKVAGLVLRKRKGNRCGQLSLIRRK